MYFIFSIELLYEQRKEIAVERMLAKNIFLNELEEKYIDPSKIFIIAGKDIFTNKEFLVDIKNKGKTKWKDGRPIKAYKTNCGDGTVTIHSALGNLNGQNILLEGNHTDILYKSKNYLSSILGKPLIKDIKEGEIGKGYIIFAENCDKINIIYKIKKCVIKVWILLMIISR